MRDSIRCDDSDQFATLVSLYTEDSEHLDGYFPGGLLLLAVKHNRCKYIEILMDKVKYKEMECALKFAVASNRCEVVRTLMYHFNKEDNGWDTQDIYGDMKPSIFEIAIKRCLPEMMKTILDMTDVYSYQVDNIEQEPLYQAGFYGSISVLEVIFTHSTSHYRKQMTTALVGAYEINQWATLEWILKQPHPAEEELREDCELKILNERIIRDGNSKILNMVNKYNMLYIDEEAMKLSQDKNWRWENKQLIKAAYEKQK